MQKNCMQKQLNQCPQTLFTTQQDLKQLKPTPSPRWTAVLPTCSRKCVGRKKTNCLIALLLKRLALESASLNSTIRCWARRRMLKCWQGLGRSNLKSRNRKSRERSRLSRISFDWQLIHMCNTKPILKAYLRFQSLRSSSIRDTIKC